LTADERYVQYLNRKVVSLTGHQLKSFNFFQIDLLAQALSKKQVIFGVLSTGDLSLSI